MSLERAIELQERSWQLESEGRFDEAAAAVREAIPLMESAEGSHSPDVANLVNELAGLELDRGSYDTAISLARQAWGILSNLSVRIRGEDAERLRIRALTILGGALRASGDYAAAERELKQAMELAQSSSGGNSEAAAWARNELGLVYRHWGRFMEASALYQSALATFVDRGDKSLAVAALYHNLCGLAHAQGHFEESAAWGRRAWAITSEQLGDNHPRTLLDRVGYAAALEGLGQLEESERLYREALPALELQLGPGHIEVAALLHNLAAVLETRGELVEAQRLYRRSLAVKQALLPDTHPEISATRDPLRRLEAAA